MFGTVSKYTKALFLTHNAMQFLNTVIKHSVVLMYFLYKHISVLSTTYYLVPLLYHYMFRPNRPSSTAVYLAKTVLLLDEVAQRGVKAMLTN
jgi:hypothetical protein